MLTSLSPLGAEAFRSHIVDFLKRWENPWLLNGTRPAKWGVHDDGKGIPTLGYGFNLQAASADTVEKAIKLALTGSTTGTLTSPQKKGLDIVLAWKAGSITTAKLLALAEAETAADDSEKQMVKHLNALNLTDAEGGRLLEAFLFGETGLFTSLEARLQTRLETLGSSLPEASKERAMLLSLFYNAETLIGPGIAAAINDDNHARLWYEIRYNHANYTLKGLQNRREAESNDIGILAPADQDDADKVLDALDYLFTRDGTGAPYPVIVARDAVINAADKTEAATQSFEAQIAPYLAVLEAEHTGGATIHFVQKGGSGNDTINPGEARHAKLSAKNTNDLVIDLAGDNRVNTGGGNDFVFTGGGKDTIDGGAGDDEIRAGDGNDDISGGPGDDILIGGRGNDRLDGGTGADTMSGGRGRDIYVVDSAMDKLSDPDLSTVIARIGLTAAFDNVGEYRNQANGLTHSMVLSAGLIDDVDGSQDGIAAYSFIGNGSDETFILDFSDTSTTATIRSGAGADRFVLSSSAHPASYGFASIAAVIVQDFEAGADKFDLSSFHAQAAEGVEEFSGGAYYWQFMQSGGLSWMSIYLGAGEMGLIPAFLAMASTPAQLGDFIV